MAPRTPKQSTSQSHLNTRRSSRINNRQPVPSGTSSSSSGGGNKKREFPNGEIPQPKRRKLQNKAELSTKCPSDDAAASDGAVPRRSQRITPSDLIKREQALFKKEQAYKQQIQDLEARNSKLTSKMDEATLQLSRVRQSEAEAALAQLEEHFTCPLQCGGWHESVDCPICRSLLVITPDRTPRLDVTFPFVPNRTAAAICESLIDKLAQFSSGCTMNVKREDSEGVWGSEWNIECSRKRGESKKEEDLKDDSNLPLWKHGGMLRSEWMKKDREGKKEMGYLLQHWTEMQAADFIALKSKLAV